MSKRWIIPNRLALIANACYALAAGFVVFLGPPAAVGIICLAPLVLFAPGYGVVGALRIADEPDLPWRRAVLAVALSMSCCILGGLALNAVAALTTAAWTAFLTSVTFATSLVGLVRSANDASRPGPARATSEPHGSTRVHLRTVAGTALALALVGAAVAITELNSRRAFDAPITQLTMSPAVGGGPSALVIAVTNLSGTPERVRLSVSAPGAALERRLLVLRTSVTWTETQRYERLPVTAAVTRAGQTKPFASVTWTGEPDDASTQR